MLLSNILAVAIHVAARNHKNLMRRVLCVQQSGREGIRCRPAGILSMSIGNNHSTIMARRKRAENAHTGRIWSRIVQRMVIVLRAEKPMKWALFATHARPERKFAASLADRSGFEPVVAV